MGTYEQQKFLQKHSRSSDISQADVMQDLTDGELSVFWTFVHNALIFNGTQLGE